MQTVLMAGTKDALLSAIIGNFPRNRIRTIREIHGQTSDFAVGASTLCSNIQITNELTFLDWLSRLPSPGNYVPRIQVIRTRIPGGPPDSPPLGPLGIQPDHETTDIMESGTGRSFLPITGAVP